MPWSQQEEKCQKGFGVGMEPTAQPTKVVGYKGAALTVRLDKV